MSQLGFLILEEVEGAFGAVQQTVERVAIADFDETWLTALNSRVLRQSVMPKKVAVGQFYCETDDQLEELSLMNNCSFVTNLDTIICNGHGVGGEGMATIAGLLPNLNARVRCVRAYKQAFAEGGAKVLRTICDALGNVSNEGMLFFVDEVAEEGDLEIGWETEAEKEQQWKMIAEIFGRVGRRPGGLEADY